MKIPILFLLNFINIAMSGECWAHKIDSVEIMAIPSQVIQTTEDAKPGIEITEAERIDDDGTIIYELEGKLRNKEYEFLISEEGVMIELEESDD